jgi:ABC-type Fe3+-hydroxamate transport system substrate-binding protein
LKQENKLVIGLGASTKGNCLLQYANITSDLLPYIAEINSYKFGRVTPGTLIPIISEEEAAAMNPDYYFVLPWHFKQGLVKNFSKFINDGGKLIFPLPEVHVVCK